MPKYSGNIQRQRIPVAVGRRQRATKLELAMDLRRRARDMCEASCPRAAKRTKLFRNAVFKLIFFVGLIEQFIPKAPSWRRKLRLKRARVHSYL